MNTRWRLHRSLLLKEHKNQNLIYLPMTDRLKLYKTDTGFQVHTLDGFSYGTDILEQYPGAYYNRYERKTVKFRK